MDTDVPPILLPCAICARTFMPQSLEKHSKICERSTIKKRKPFDSAKQRIQGTELADFLPKQEKKRHSSDDKSSKPKSSWKQTHDDFLRAVRAARNEIVDSTMQRQCGTTVTANAPTRANEQGTCPTCNRHFGVKAYDRHVAWCKERITRVSVSPATNVAKERLEARMKYRAPSVKSRRQTTREKYSPGSAITLSAGNKTSPTLVAAKAKECVSAPSCNKSNDSPIKQKSAVVRRSGQQKESNPTVSMKPRPVDRVNSRPPEDEAGAATFRPVPPVKRISHLPVPPVKHKREIVEECLNLFSLRPCKKLSKKTPGKVKRDEIASQKNKQDEKYQVISSARSQKANIVSARSQGNPKVNDVSINDEIVGITVKPCNIYRESPLTTWKQISQNRDYGSGSSRKSGKQNERHEEDASSKFSHVEDMEDLSVYEKQLEEVSLALTGDDMKEEASKLSSRSGSINWPTTTSMLNRTYSFRDSVANDKVDDVQIAKGKKWKPVKHSPRVEFCLGDPEKAGYIHVSASSSNYSREENAVNDTPSKNTAAIDAVKENVKAKTVVKGERNDAQSDEQDFHFEAAEGKLSSDGMKSSRSRILERKRLRSVAYEDVSVPNNREDDDTRYSSNNLTAVHSEKGLQDNNNMVNDKSAASENRLDTKDDAKESLRSPISSEKLAYLDEFDRFCEQIDLESNNEIVNNDVEEEDKEVNRLSSRSNRTASEMNGKDSGELDNAEIKDSVDSLQDETLECATKDENMDGNVAFYNMEATEADWIMEDESDPLLEEGILQPTRSSTPFIHLEDCSSAKCDDYGNLKQEKLCLPIDNPEWKVEIDTERGSELLYRVECRDSNCSSSRRSTRSKVAKSRRSVCENDTLQYQNCLSGRYGECNKSMEGYPRISSSRTVTPLKERDARSRTRSREHSKITSPAAQEEQPIKLPKLHRKEIASQINICNCSLEVSSKTQRCEKGVGEGCVNSVRSNPYSEAQVCTVFVNKNETVINQFNTILEKDSSGKVKSADVSSNSTKIFDESASVKADASNEEVREIYKNCTNNDFECDSDNSMEHHIRDAINDLKASASKNDKVKRNMRSIVLSESCMKLNQRIRVDDSSTVIKSRRSKRLEIENKIRENTTTVLNESTDSSVSSIDAMDIKQAESVEIETIEEIGTRNRNIRFRILPEIKGTALVVKENYDEKERINTQTYWEKASGASRINLNRTYQGASRFLKRNPKVRILPPVPSSSSLVNYRDLKLPLRPVWSNYVRRRPDFNLVLSGRTGKDYDPFLLAEQQMNDLLSDTSEHSVTDSLPMEQNRDSSFPLSHSSAFVKYPSQSFASPEKRSSLIAPPTEFDDLMSDFSSDSTETNSLSREVFLKELKESRELKDSISKSDVEKKSPVRELGRRVIIDKSKALGGDVIEDTSRGSRSFVGSSEKARKILDKVSPNVIRPSVNRSLSVRASSAPKTTTSTADRKISDSSHEKRSSPKYNDVHRSGNSLNSRNNNYANLSSSNLSLSSIMSSDVDIKRSNSVFDELMNSFEDENGSFPSLKSFLKNDSLSMSSPVHGRQRNGQISDDELSSPESYKRQDHSKMSADSAYSSLNRKYSHHGRSTNDVAGRFDEETSRSNRREGDTVTMPKCKMSKFCHECGSRFPETAKFCCECGIRRLVL